MILALLALLATLVRFGPAPLDVADFGAKGDGRTDDTKAFQRALDSAAKKNLPVSVGSGNFVFLGKLNVPDGVTIKGTWESVPSHNGVRNPGLPKPTDGGSTFLVEGGEGAEAGAFLTLNTNSTLKGVVIYYPKQDPRSVPKPYPWAIAMRGKNPAVLDVELLNPYNGIDASDNERHLIRNVSGQPLRRGIYVDGVFDIGRIENVHFNPWWSMQPKLFEWQEANGEAFVFSRTDWEYVLNTFAFGYGVGYRFLASKSGACNGNFLGIGADDCNVAVKVEQAASFGLLITNGEFTSFYGPNPTQVVVDAGNSGVVRFSNCAFWGPCDRIADIAGTGTVGFADCTFVQWDGRGKGLAAIRATGGNVMIRGCEFREDKEHVLLEAGVRRAIVTDNLTPKALRLKAANPAAVKSN